MSSRWRSGPAPPQPAADIRRSLGSPLLVSGDPSAVMLTRRLRSPTMKPPPGRVPISRARQLSERRAGLIKRIRLATARRGLGREEFAGGWREAVAAAASAPERARPVRLTVSVGLPEITADQPHDGV